MIEAACGDSDKRAPPLPDAAPIVGVILTTSRNKRRLMDVRRSGVVEAIAGDAAPLGLSAKLANSIERSNTLHKTYAPVDIEAVRNTDAARLKGKRRMRAADLQGWVLLPRRRVIGSKD